MEKSGEYILEKEREKERQIVSEREGKKERERRGERRKRKKERKISRHIPTIVIDSFFSPFCNIFYRKLLPHLSYSLNSDFIMKYLHFNVESV